MFECHRCDIVIINYNWGMVHILINEKKNEIQKDGMYFCFAKH